MNVAATNKAIAKLIEERPWIAHIDTDEPGNWIVTLHQPWCFYADPGCGVRGFDSLSLVKKGTTALDVYESLPVTSKKVEAHEVTPEIEAFILGIAAGVADAKKATAKKRGRKSMLTPIEAALASGQVLPLEFKSEANYTYNRHADRIYKAALANDLEGLEAIEITGVNTYAKALRGYRDLLIGHLKGSA